MAQYCHSTENSWHCIPGTFMSTFQTDDCMLLTLNCVPHFTHKDKELSRNHIFCTKFLYWNQLETSSNKNATY